jgi:hypothetical protein
LNRLIEFPLEGGGSITAEVEESPGKTIRGAGSAVVLEKAQQTFEASLERIKPAAAAIIARLRELRDSPEQVNVEFGITMNAAAGVVVASSGVNAHFKISITWKREPNKTK